MRLLLDTHTVIWWLADDPTLAEETKVLIETEPDVCVSSATLWEVAIKQAIGKVQGAHRPAAGDPRSGVPRAADHA